MNGMSLLKTMLDLRRHLQCSSNHWFITRRIAKRKLTLNTRGTGVGVVPARAEYWRSVRTSYDTVASEYAKRIYSELKDKPFDRDWLDQFADRVRRTGRVCDLGCGPGHVARYLHDRGVDVFGLDLSPAMLEEARRLNPDIEFVVGTMMSLNMKSESLAGIVALYSIIHMKRSDLGTAFAEMWRVLRPGGRALVAFHVGSNTIHNTEWWGYTVNLNVTFFTTRDVVKQLERASFAIEAAAERDPYADVEYQSRRSYIAALKERSAAMDAQDA